MSMCSRVFILVLCCVAGLAQNVSAAKSEAASSYAPIGNILDPATYFFGFFYQIFPANIDVIFPFTILPRLNPSIEFFRLNRCPRPTVPSCLPVDASTRFPKTVQGFWWFYDIGLEDEGTTTGSGDWNPQLRIWTVYTGQPRSWAFKDTNSTLLFPLPFWSPSGAGLYNFIIYSGIRTVWVFNEDFTFAQIYYVLPVLYIPIIIPQFILDMSQTLIGPGLWRRDTSAYLGLLDVPSGNYLWKQAFDGAGNPGPYFQEFIKARNGSDVMVATRVFPPS